MSAKIQSQKAAQAPRIAIADTTARFAVSEDGHLIFANDPFCALSKIRMKDAGGIDADSIIRLAGSGFGTAKKHLKDITSGTHNIFVGAAEGLRSFHFDWVTTSDQKRYLIASEIDPHELGDAEGMDDFTSTIRQLMESRAKKTTPGNKSVKPVTEIKAQEDLQHFLDLSHDVMIVIDSEGGFSRANKTFYSVFGYSKDEIQAINFADLFDNKVQSRRKTKSEALMRTKDGEPRWIEWHQEAKGAEIYLIGRDLTETKRHEANLTKRQNQLSEAESIGRMGHWHWTIGQDNLEWSNEIFRIFGVDQDNFRPTIHELNDMVHKHDVGRVSQGFQRAIIEEKDYDMEFRITQPEGDIRFIHCEGRCEKDASGEVIALYGIMQDMTERMLYERDLREAKDAAERAYATKSQFLANMSHELRTPLNAILGFSQMMQKQLLGPIGTPKYMEYVDGIYESGEHLLDLISDILDMSKIEAGKYELDLEEIKVTEILKLAAHMMHGRAEEAGIKISTEQLTNETLEMVGDRRALLQIMLNLLSNAVKFTENGGAVSVECHERKDFISIKVVDNGIGIPPNKLAQITRPFEQGSTSYARDHEGTGLGLAITKELTELHNGTFSIESKQGKGTTATVRLPYDASVKR